ncbi:MAG: tetratricopeptide repeat protein [Acidimicrobiia bacterium]|nr:tetratricopeptide repeat protein [Acidimicrobiia bacterium]
MSRQRSALTSALAVSGIVLLVNTAYVWAFASPTVFYVANVLLHLALGIAVSIGGAVLLAREPALRRTLGPAALAMAVALGFAIVLIVRGNISDHRWALRAHIVAGLVAAVAALPSAWRAMPQSGRVRTLGAVAVAATALVFLLPIGVRQYQKFHPNPSHRIVNPLTAPLSMEDEGGGPASPFFPSAAKTNVGGIIPSDFFMDSAICGECHRDIYDQWKGSAHRFSSFNNQFYRKAVEYMQSVGGLAPSKWCAGCHDHAMFFNGRFERPVTDQIDTPEAHAGLACTSCHSIVHVEGSMGNGAFTIEYPPLHELATSRNRYIRALDRFVTYLNPKPHRRSFMKPFMREDSSEFCAACHKAHLDVPVNNYRWLRGFNDYDSWQSSGVSHQGARSFYYPEKATACIGCHMPPVTSTDPGRHEDGTVHSHRFRGANTAVPFVNHDATQLKETERFLTSGFVRVDIFAISPINELSAETRPGREIGNVAAPVDRVRPALAPGSTVRVDVVVRTVRAGHFFPGGTADAFDIWLELQGRDGSGRVIFWSGQVRDGGTGPVDEASHFYRSLLLDAKGNPIDKRNTWQARASMYVRHIPHGSADAVHFRVRIPKDAQGPITFTAKLNHRKFAHAYTQFAYAGEPEPGQDPALLSSSHNSLRYSFDPANIPANVSGQIKDRIPDLPITVLAEATATAPLGDIETPATWTPVVLEADRERWNDWGIGLLLQGDLRGAGYAFTQVTIADPGYADGWINVARALIQEGDTAGARRYVDRALTIAPLVERFYYWKALIQKADGDYEGALTSLETVAAKYPRDRVVLNQIARLLFLQRKYAEALGVLERVSRVDPEDVQLHFTAMLCYRALGRADEAAREERLFLRFKADESSQAITGARRLERPEENIERQEIHEHESGHLPGLEPRRPVQAGAARQDGN